VLIDVASMFMQQEESTIEPKQEGEISEPCAVDFISQLMSQIYCLLLRWKVSLYLMKSKFNKRAKI
jgi:hypothetical protein